MHPYMWETYMKCHLWNVIDACSAYTDEEYPLHMSLIGVNRVLLLNILKSNNYSLIERI